MGATSIEWVDFSWNPIRGTKGRHICQRISPGCLNCYAATMNRRFSGIDYVAGADDPRLDEKALREPLGWKKPMTVFPCSMTDLFWHAIPDEWIDRIFAVMALTPRHTYRLLTKRTARMRNYLTALGTKDGYERLETAARSVGWTLRYERIPLLPWPIPNVWVGGSVENQAAADERVMDVLLAPAAKYWLSIEPLLGPVSLRDYYLDRKLGRPLSLPIGPEHRTKLMDLFDWIVVGGESGPKARPCDLAWVRDIAAQCREAEVSLFVKQLGARPYQDWAPSLPPLPLRKDGLLLRPFLNLKDPKGGEMAEWPEDLRERTFPS